MIWRLFIPSRPYIRFLLRHLFSLRVENQPAVLPRRVILAPNHISLIDWLFLICLLPCRIRFVMRHDYCEGPVRGWLARNSDIIPICSPNVSRTLLKSAMEEIQAALDRGQPICIFAEGRLTRDGSLGRLEPGVIRMARRFKAELLPVGITGLWPTVWGMGRLRGYWWRPWAPTCIRFGQPLDPKRLRVEELAEVLGELSRQGP